MVDTAKREYKNQLSTFNGAKIAEVPYPNHLRLLINSECNYACSFPGTCVKWCHEDGGHVENKKFITATDDFIFLAKALKDIFNIERIKIGAMEPLLYPELAQLVSGLKEIVNDISLTTNGYYLKDQIGKLHQSGLESLVVSLHAFNRLKYREITGVDGFEKVKEGILLAKKSGVKLIKINRVLLNFYNSWEDLMEFISWAEKAKIDAVRLYQLMWTDNLSDKEYYQNYLNWSHLMGFIQNNATLTKVEKYTIPARERYYWQLKSGMLLEADFFEPKINNPKASKCQNCPKNVLCQEGLFSFGYEFNSELSLIPCLLRPELAVSFAREVKKRDSGAIERKIRKTIGTLIAKEQIMG